MSAFIEILELRAKKLEADVLSGNYSTKPMFEPEAQPVVEVKPSPGPTPAKKVVAAAQKSKAIDNENEKQTREVINNYLAQQSVNSSQIQPAEVPTMSFELDGYNLLKWAQNPSTAAKYGYTIATVKTK